MKTWPIGPALQLHLPEAHDYLLKAAVQRVISDKLRGCASTHEATAPFLHHWVLSIAIERKVRLQNRTLKDEEYTLTANRQRNGLTHVRLRAASDWGALLGLQSLRQLIAITHTAGQLRGVLHLSPLTERPQHAHRAVRIAPETNAVEIRRIMDECAQLKYNMVHWALQAAPDRLAHPLAAVRMLIQYAYQRGLAVLFELTPWGNPTQERQFMQAFMPLSTAPLLQAEGVALPDNLPHAIIRPQPRDGWQPGDIVHLDVPDTQQGYEDLTRLRLTKARGAVLALPANLLALLQVAALLWDPAARALTSDDKRVMVAVRSLWYDQGLEVTQPHAMDVELLRLREANHRPDGGLVQ